MALSRRKKDAPKPEDVWVTWASAGYGTTIYLAYIERSVSPVGLVWGHGVGTDPGGKTRFEVWGSFVPLWCRRMGIRTRINETILEHYQLITTQSGSKDGGLAFLKANGYRREPKTSIWFKTREYQRRRTA